MDSDGIHPRRGRRKFQLGGCPVLPPKSNIAIISTPIFESCVIKRVDLRMGTKNILIGALKSMRKVGMTLIRICFSSHTAHVVHVLGEGG
jgi:hypothetical protein